MCGRFALFAPEEQIIKHYKLKQGFKMISRYNVAPASIIPIIRGHQLDFVRWGFIPRWVKPEDSDQKGHINARAETVADKPSFKAAFAKRRCLIPVSGYYEWKTIGGKKQPYFISLPQSPIMSLAGIWESHRDMTMEMVDTAAILTVEASGPASAIHHRMPLLIKEQDYHAWLDDKTPIETLNSLLLASGYDFRCQAVSTKVNNPKVDSPECVYPLS